MPLTFAFPAEKTQVLPPLVRTLAVLPALRSVLAAAFAAVLVVWQETFTYLRVLPIAIALDLNELRKYSTATLPVCGVFRPPNRNAWYSAARQCLCEFFKISAFGIPVFLAFGVKNTFQLKPL